MAHNDSQLRDLLVELENLRSREERLRRNSDAIAAALQALGELTDGRQGPALLADHLAGALGVKTFLGLKHIPDWRWLLNRADTPFYPSLTLYRQAAVNDWSEVFARMTRDVKALMSKGR